MLNAFEQRLIELLTDTFAGPPPAGEPRVRVLARAGEPAPANTDVSIAVELRQATVWPDFGDDALTERRVGDAWRLRTEFALSGEASMGLAALTGTPAQRRERLMRGLDRLLVALGPPDIRHGTAFQTSEDRGFAIDGFRLVRWDADPLELPDPNRARLVYAWHGHFWPVREEPEGPAIAVLPTRVAVLPMRLPERLVVRAGSGANPVPVRVDLRATGGASPRLFARIKGTGPGVLVGSGVVAADGFVGSEPAADGVFPLTYQPPDSVDARTRLAIEFSLGSVAGRSVALEDLPVEVLPP